MKNTTFCNLYCSVSNCLPEEFVEQLFWFCSLPLALLLARLLWRIHRDYFKPDLELIARVKDLTDAIDVKAEFHDYYYHHPPSGCLRGMLKLGISGQRLMNLANRLFASAERKAGPAMQKAPV